LKVRKLQFKEIIFCLTPREKGVQNGSLKFLKQ